MATETHYGTNRWERNYLDGLWIIGQTHNYEAYYDGTYRNRIGSATAVTSQKLKDIGGNPTNIGIVQVSDLFEGINGSAGLAISGYPASMMSQQIITYQNEPRFRWYGFPDDVLVDVIFGAQVNFDPRGGKYTCLNDGRNVIVNCEFTGAVIFKDVEPIDGAIDIVQKAVTYKHYWSMYELRLHRR